MGQQYPTSTKSKVWKLLQRFGVIIALLASIATIVGLLFEIKSEKRLIDLQIISADQLTQLPPVSGFEGEFTYNDVPVEDLWKVRLQFVNSGDVTLIGKGGASSLMNNLIQISFPGNTKILSVGVSSKVQTLFNVTQSDTNMIEIEFSQWRPGESFEIELYVSSSSILESPPLPRVLDRPIIDGDIQLIDFTVKEAAQARPAIDYLPKYFALAGRIFGGILAIMVGLYSLGYLVIFSPFSFLRAQYWKSKYLASFQKHLNRIKLPTKDKKVLLETPWLLEYAALPSDLILGDGPVRKRKTNRSSETPIRKAPRSSNVHNQIWDGFDGPYPPQPSFETLKGTIIAFIIGLILAISCSAILASMIIV